MRRFDDGSSSSNQKNLWAQYCGFLDFSMHKFMTVQERLLMEQLVLLSRTGLGKRFFAEKAPRSIDEFRATVPLTTYSDYSAMLASKRDDLLPEKPSVWIRTAWEGGNHPVRYAPYTPSMLESYRNNLIASMVLSTSTGRGKTALRPRDSILCGMPPLPYETGLLPHIFEGHLDLNFLPPMYAHESMSVADAAELGLRLGLKNGIDLFFGMASFACRLGDSFSLAEQKGGASPHGEQRPQSEEERREVDGISSRGAARMLRAIARAKAEKRKVKPADAFSLKGLVIAGTDSAVYKEKIRDQWGITPHEVSGGAEATIVGTETWAHNGLVFFPDSNFYEFIPEADMLKNAEDPEFVPRTVLMNEIRSGENYELVLTTLHGGAFVRYRLGDMYKCLKEKDRENGIDLPLLQYLDRVPNVIDIAGFTRITAETIDEALALSKLQVSRYFAIKEHDSQKRPFMHIYIEMDEDAVYSTASTANNIREQLSVYFKYLECEYGDLQQFFGRDPLVVDILPSGCIDEYENATGKSLRKVNPSRYDVIELLRKLRPTTFFN